MIALEECNVPFLRALFRVESGDEWSTRAFRRIPPYQSEGALMKRNLRVQMESKRVMTVKLREYAIEQHLREKKKAAQEARLKAQRRAEKEARRVQGTGYSSDGGYDSDGSVTRDGDRATRREHGTTVSNGGPNTPRGDNPPPMSAPSRRRGTVAIVFDKDDDKEGKTTGAPVSSRKTVRAGFAEDEKRKKEE